MLTFLRLKNELKNETKKHYKFVNDLGIMGIMPHLKLGLRDYAPFEIGIMGLQGVCKAVGGGGIQTSQIALHIPITGPRPKRTL